MQTYPAIFTDRFGTEQTEILSDGSCMYLTLRGIDFEGSDFEALSGIIDDSKFDYVKYEDGSGDITHFALTVTLPLVLFDKLTQSTSTEKLKVYVVVGKLTTIDGLDSEITSLSLSTSFGNFSFDKKLEWMEDALIGLQNKLPDHIYLKNCLSCKFSNYHPVGNGMFGAMCCFKNYKAEVELLTSKYDLMDLWTAERIQDKSLFFVQETFVCPDHQFLSENDYFYKSYVKYL